jgi:HicB family
MDLSEHVDALRAHLLTAAGAGTEQTQATARLLADTLEPAVRLVVTDALSAMAAEVTAAWDGGLVDIRLRGRDPEVVVVPAPQADDPAPADEPSAADDDGSTARISLRLPESLKARAEDAAAAAGTSLNTWLVRAVATGLRAPTPPPHTGRGPRSWSGFARS